ncbi:MAG: hypothetical protein ACPGVG_00365 [Mycobacterium sp.]
MFPDDRLNTYTGGDPVEPQDMNELQDATRFAKHGRTFTYFSPRQMRGDAGWVYEDNGSFWDRGWVAPVGGGALIHDPPMRPSSTILRVVAWWSLEGFSIPSGDPGDDLFVAIRLIDPFLGITTDSRVSLLFGEAGPLPPNVEAGPTRIRFSFDFENEAGSSGSGPVTVPPNQFARLQFNCGIRGRRFDGYALEWRKVV